jgi:hypothetical protein
MKKHGEDQPPKKVPTDRDLKKLANEHPKADQDTSYQDNKGKAVDVDGKNNALDNTQAGGQHS